MKKETLESKAKNVLIWTNGVPKFDARKLLTVCNHQGRFLEVYNRLMYELIHEGIFLDTGVGGFSLDSHQGFSFNPEYNRSRLLFTLETHCKDYHNALREFSRGSNYGQSLEVLGQGEFEVPEVIGVPQWNQIRLKNLEHEGRIGGVKSLIGVGVCSYLVEKGVLSLAKEGNFSVVTGTGKNQTCYDLFKTNVSEDKFFNFYFTHKDDASNFKKSLNIPKARVIRYE